MGKGIRFLFLIVAMLFSSLLRAGELPQELQAKLVRMVVASMGGKVSCRDASMKAALLAAGVTVEDGAKIVWTTSAAESKLMKSAGKLVLCGKAEFLGSGAGVAFVESGGKPKLVVSQPNVAASGLSLSDAVLKAADKA